MSIGEIIISLFISSFKSDKEKLELNLDIGETYYQNIQSNTNIDKQHYIYISSKWKF